MSGPNLWLARGQAMSAFHAANHHRQSPEDRCQPCKEVLRSCRRKVRYDTEHEARRAVAEITLNAVEPYLCPPCGLWHLTTVQARARSTRYRRRLRRADG